MFKKSVNQPPPPCCYIYWTKSNMPSVTSSTCGSSEGRYAHIFLHNKEGGRKGIKHKIVFLSRNNVHLLMFRFIRENIRFLGLLNNGWRIFWSLSYLLSNFLVQFRKPTHCKFEIVPLILQITHSYFLSDFALVCTWYVISVWYLYQNDVFIKTSMYT